MRNFAVEEIAAHAHEEDYVSGTARAAGIIGGWPRPRSRSRSGKASDFFFRPRGNGKILNGNLSAAAAHPN